MGNKILWLDPKEVGRETLEYMQCTNPDCLTFETLEFIGGVLQPTRRFRQIDGHVIHDCGWVCRVIPTGVK